MACNDCGFVQYLMESAQNNKEYWMATEVFVYLHGGKDYCDRMV